MTAVEPAGVTARRRDRPNLRSIMRLIDLTDYIIPYTIRAVAELGVADHLVDGPRRVEEVAEATGSDAPSLLRALRALACKGIFTEVEPGSFGLTPLAEPLCTTHPQSLRRCLPLMPPALQAWARLDDAVRTGSTGWALLHDRPVWDHLAEHPDDSRRFNGSLAALALPELRQDAAKYPWYELGCLAAVGPGGADLLAALLRRYPVLEGVVVDNPAGLAAATTVLADAGVDRRCRLVPADVLEAVPVAAPAYLLGAVLPAWTDTQAGAALAAVRAAMGPGSRLLVLDSCPGPPDNLGLGLVADVQAMALTGGRARTVHELVALVRGAGLRVVRKERLAGLLLLDARTA